MKPEIFENNSDGIKCVYNNDNWCVSIKNWKPDNDINGIKHLEVHTETDEQFILVNGQAILITAKLIDEGFEDIELTKMKIGNVYNVQKNGWFYSITQSDTKMVYVQHANTSMDNSELRDLTPNQIKSIQEKAKKLFEY